MKSFISTFAYRLIYVFRINDNIHKGLLKVGEATCITNKNIEELLPNCKELNNSAKNRINQYTTTAGISYDLLHTELAVLSVSKNGKTQIKAFSDHDVHKVLERSEIKRHYFDTQKKANEWFVTDLETVKKAILAVKQGRSSLLSSEISQDKSPIIFRPEQAEAIKITKAKFKSGNRMLWNAKMRFGKTLTALQVAKEMGFAKTIILTHRPVVSDGWYDDFGKIFYDTDYIFGSKTKGEKIENLVDTDKKFVYFASMQDLRGSSAVGGKFDKNEDIFLIDWDYVVIDEAHEGTLTKLGLAVIDELCGYSKKPKVLRLSGTPFNLLDQFKEDEIYTWDYVMEQREKRNWNLHHFGDSNPYASLPELQIFTYDLNKLISGYFDEEDQAFNFREFFRTWTGVMEKDFKPIPAGSKVGDFVHKDDVNAFLNLLCKKDNESNYPFSTDEYRNYFRHSLWMVPGVKEAKALSALLNKHPIFGSGMFKIVNVAGAGDEEVDSKDALAAVRKAFGSNPAESYTITISCGRLTTGVSVPEWTAVFMLAGTFSTAASAYLQTIFRVQTPANINGQVKERCCVFDFAPDRTLKMVAQAGKLSAKAGDTSTDRVLMGEFLNFCPVIGIDGSKMKEFNVDSLLQQLKKAYTERVVKNGFDDPHIYNDNLLKLDQIALGEFESLKAIIGVSKQTNKQGDIDINKQGLTNEQYEELKRIEKKPKKELTDEEKALLEERKKQRSIAETARSILRGISIRIPLLIYGADVPFDKEITSENFTDLIDDNSWQEFMPKGVDKETFKKFSKYYEQDVFVSAGRQIRNKAKAADNLMPTERVKRIVEIFNTFKNPDKETVLTPWRVVNMHLGHCLGGYDFYNDTHEELLEEPVFKNKGKATANTVSNINAKILEINSKSGLYPLYIVYSIYRKRCSLLNPDELTKDKQLELWNKTVQDNIFVICKTPMAKYITKRTLLGYKNIKINAHSFEDLIMQLKDKPEQFKEKVSRGSYWNKEYKDMKFDAIVGNPPYQLMDGGAQASATPIYNHFVDASKKICPKYISMIMPSRWMTGGKGLDNFRNEMINDTSFSEMYDYFDATECFSNVEIKGGVCYFLWDSNYSGKCNIKTYFSGQKMPLESCRYLVEPGDDIFIRDSRMITIKDKVLSLKEESFENIVSSMKPYGLRGDFFKSPAKYNLPSISDTPILGGYSIIGLNEKMQRVVKYISKTYPLPKKDMLNDYKIFVTRNYGNGTLGELPASPIFAKPGEVCTETFIQIGPFKSDNELKNCYSYFRTKFFRLLVGIKKRDQGAGKNVYQYVPLQDFSKSWTDEELFEKYKLTNDEIDYINEVIKV